MFLKSSRPAPTSPAPADDGHDTTQAIETFRFVVDLMVKTWAFLVAADGLLLGFGVTRGTAGPILLGALVSFVTALIPPLLSRSLVPVAYVAYSKELDRGNERGLVVLYARVAHSRLAKEMEQIHRGDPDAVTRRLRRLSHGPRFLGRRLTLLLIVVSLAQVALGIYFLSEHKPFF